MGIPTLPRADPSLKFDRRPAWIVVRYLMARTPRVEYSELPAGFHASINRALGAEVVSASNAGGGFSPGPAAACVLDDERTVFIKACSFGMNAVATAMHQREAAVLAEMPRSIPAPAFVAAVDVDGWFGLVTEHIDGVMPVPPFSPAEVDGVLQTVTDLALAGARCPLQVADPVGTHDAERATRWAWRQLRDDGQREAAGSWVGDHLDQLVEIEADWVEAAAGEALVHRDLRADNMLLTESRGVVVDWATASVGAPWVDLVGLLPDLHLGGGPDPHVAFGAHPVGAAAPSDAVDCYLASLSGYFTRQSLQPPIPGITGLREFQAAQGRISRRWLAARLGWDSEI